MNVSERLKTIRESRNFSISKLATRSGVSQSYIREIERGLKKPTVEYLSYLCEALDITLSDFFDDAAAENFAEDPVVYRVQKLKPSQKEALNTILDLIEK